VVLFICYLLFFGIPFSQKVSKRFSNDNHLLIFSDDGPIMPNVLVMWNSAKVLVFNGKMANVEIQGPLLALKKGHHE